MTEDVAACALGDNAISLAVDFEGTAGNTIANTQAKALLGMMQDTLQDVQFLGSAH